MVEQLLYLFLRRNGSECGSLDSFGRRFVKQQFRQARKNSLIQTLKAVCPMGLREGVNASQFLYVFVRKLMPAHLVEALEQFGAATCEDVLALDDRDAIAHIRGPLFLIVEIGSSPGGHMGLSTPP